MKHLDLTAVEQTQTIVQSRLPELLRAEEAKIITELVNAHNSGKLSDRDAAVGVAVLARIRRIYSSLDRAITSGIAAGHRLTR